MTTEQILVPGRRLGRRPPKMAARLRLSNYLTGVVPAHPAAADDFSKVSDWGLYGNDQYGDCGPVSVANQRKLVTRYLTGVEHSVSLQDVLDLYRRSGNPNFPADDNGVDMQTMCEALVAGGIAGVKALGFAAVDVTNLDELRAAIAIFGSLLLGVDLEIAQQSQAVLWDYSASGVWGGHAVLAGRYSSKAWGDDIDVISWGGVVGTTDQFAAHQLAEAWVVLWPEHMGSTAFLEGVDLAALAADYQALTGRSFPAPVAPPPDPGPGPGPKPSGCFLTPVVGVISLFTRLFGGSS